MPDGPVSFGIHNRPFAIERFTNVMLPDGIFDSAIHYLDIGFCVTNTYDHEIHSIVLDPILDTPGRDWSFLGSNRVEISNLPKGATRLVRWRANFQGSAPGKKQLGIRYNVIISEGWSHGDNVVLGVVEEGEIFKEIFVSRTSYDVKSDLYACEVPEGTIAIKFLESRYFPPIEAEWTADGVTKEVVYPPIGLPTKIDGVVVPAAGSELLLPFNDPWWKVVAWIVAVIAAIAAIIVAKQGEGTAYVSISGTGNDDITDYDLCVPDPTKNKDKENLAGYLSVLASTAMRIGMADAKDPWQKGREHFSGLLGDEAVKGERVVAEIQPPRVIGAGRALAVPISWSYELQTIDPTTDHRIQRDEIGENSHVAAGVGIEVSEHVKPYDLIWLKLENVNINGELLAGDGTYGCAVFIPPDEDMETVTVDLLDYNPRTGEKFSKGVFYAELDLEKYSGMHGAEKAVGRWRVRPYMQNVNDARLGMSPLEAATHVGGDFIVGPKEIVFPEPPDPEKPEEPEQKSCPVDKEIEIVVDAID